MSLRQREQDFVDALKLPTQLPDYVSQEEGNFPRVDVWLVWPWDLTFGDTASLMLQLGYILHTSVRHMPRSRLRIMQLYEDSSAADGSDAANTAELEGAVKRLENLLTQARITATEFALLKWSHRGSVPASQMGRPGADRPSLQEQLLAYRSLNELIQQHSAHTSQTLLALPQLPCKSSAELTDVMAEEYLQCLSVLTDGLPPTALVQFGEEQHVIAVNI